MASLVSVIIPTYKGAENLSRAIDSVLSQLYDSIEIIVVDDNDPSTIERTQTEEVMKKYKEKGIYYIQHERNKNGAAARNTGIARAEGEYICFLDDDDFYFEERIKRSVEVIEKNQFFDAVYCNVIITNKTNIKGIIRANKVLTQKDILLNEMAIGTGSNIFLKRKVFTVLKEFDESFKRHQDLEFMLRLLQKFNINYLEEFLIVKATNETNNIPKYEVLSSVKNLYFAKFRSVINSLSDEDREEFYSIQYRELFLSALTSKNKAYIKKATEDLKEIRNIKYQEKALVFLFTSRLLNERMYKILKNINNAVKNKRTIYKLNEDKNDRELEFCRKIIKQSN